MTRPKPVEYSLPDGGSITASALKRKGREAQRDVMRRWFFENYEDPVESTPYEDGYVFIYGGPFDAHEELSKEFAGTVPDEVIEELADELSDISHEWTSTSREGFYDDFDIEVSADYLAVFRSSIMDILSLLAEPVESLPSRRYLNRLLYGNVITALECFLSDFFIYRINEDHKLFRKFIETTPAFKQQNLSVSEVFRAMDAIEQRAKSYLSSVVWHRLKIVASSYKNVLDVEFPDTKELREVIKLRHELFTKMEKRKTAPYTKLGSPTLGTPFDL
jgi:hypothetical protein